MGDKRNNLFLGMTYVFLNGKIGLGRSGQPPDAGKEAAGKGYKPVRTAPSANPQPACRAAAPIR